MAQWNRLLSHKKTWMETIMEYILMIIFYGFIISLFMVPPMLQK
jgi:hypothetical protein